MVISFTLGAMAESYLRRALQINGFNLTCFFTRPISLVFIIAAVISMGMSIRKHMTAVLSGAEEVGEEED
jgi:putative tricarboxylic transport membrane protein